MTQRRAKKIEQKKKMFYFDMKQIKKEAKDIFESENAQQRREHIQHGNTSVHKHCMDVARRCVRVNRKLGLNAVERDLIRGAILHDYFLYDWHTRKKENNEYLHGFTHPRKALINAEREFDLSSRERDIIDKHMWPMTIHRIPKCRECWIVVAVDKYSAVAEMAKRAYQFGARKLRWRAA